MRAARATDANHVLVASMEIFDLKRACVQSFSGFDSRIDWWAFHLQHTDTPAVSLTTLPSRRRLPDEGRARSTLGSVVQIFDLIVDGEDLAVTAQQGTGVASVPIR